jgi:hypothetical protein
VFQKDQLLLIKMLTVLVPLEEQVEPLLIRIMLQELMVYNQSEVNTTGNVSTTFNVVDFGLYQIRVVDANGCSV